MRNFTKFISLLFMIMFLSSTIVAQEMQRREIDPNAKTATITQERLDAIENGSTFTVPERGADDAVDVHFVIHGDMWSTVDNSRYNIWSYSDGAYLYPAVVMIGANVTHDFILTLEGGQMYAVEMWDDFGDGGIFAEIYYNATGGLIISWIDGAWSGTYGFYNFNVDNPPMATNPTPADMAIDVGVGSLLLAWTQAAGVDNMEVLFGTEYPPTDVIVPWGSPLVSSALVDVDWNQQYFWQINYTHPGYVGVQTGDVWGFTTLIKPPGELTATLFDAEADGAWNDVRLEWTSSIVVPPINRALIGYDIYQNGAMIASGVTSDDYVVSDAPYEMTVGNDYWAIAVFDEGVSAPSNTANTFVNGLGTFYGYAYDNLSMDPLGGVTIDLVGEDPQMGPWIYQVVTDQTGYYEIDVIAGTYDFTGSLWQYFDVEYMGVGVGFAVMVQQDLYLDPWGPPACATDPVPFDTEQDVNANGTTLYWTLDPLNTTVEWRLMFDTEYPPVDVMVDWTDVLAEEYALPALEPNLQYFWQIQVRNVWGEVTDCDIWGFTTTITVPGSLTATVYDIDNVMLEWESSESDRAFIEYVVYQDGLEIGTTTDVMYDVTDLPYNASSCYDFNVEAVFDEGVSVWSNTASACITGFGMVDGFVMELLTSDPIEGAMVYLDGMGELGDPFTYTFYTDEFGYYEGDVMVGDYDYTVTAAGYLPGADMGSVEYDTYTSIDFYLDEYPDPLAYVIATELNDDEAHLEWGFGLAFTPTYFPFDTEGMTDVEIERHMIDFLGTMGVENATDFTMEAIAEGGLRDLMSYNVYRGLWDDDFMDMVYVGNTTQSQFIDYDWGMQPSGVYKWAVEVVYTNNNSIPTFSNYLDKDMETLVNVDVTLNSAEDPSGTSVTLTNTSEPYLNLTYNATLDATGMYTFDPFRKGEYNVLVSLWGYGTVTDAVSIYDETDLSYLLYEIIADPMDFYVNPNGFATWVGELSPPVFSIDEDFSDGIPSSWSQILYSGTGEWTWCNDCGASSSVTPPGDDIFAVADNDEYNTDIFDVGLFTAAMDLSGETSVVMDYDRNFQDYAGEGEMAVRVYSGSTSNFEEELDWATSDDPSGGGHHTYTFDPSGYLDPGAVYVEFWYSSEGGTNNWGFGIDNVEINVGSKSGTRELQSYKLWLDNVLSGEPTEEWWDYEANEALVEGQTYLAEVASVYTTGISNKVPYTFTYYPCTHFDGPTSVNADVVVGTMHVLVSWTPVASNVPGDDVVGVNVFRDGELIAMVPVGDNFFLDEQLGSGDYEYCITNFYQSEAQSCQVCDMVTVTPGGYVNGYVTEFATGDPIEGAAVAIVGPDAYVFYTDDMGYYEGEVIAGTYDYAASASGYQTEELMDVFIDFGVTISQDFALKEYPYPVGEVIAWEVNDNSVQVSWNGQGGPGVAEWIRYDEGTNSNNLGTTAAFTIAWANKFEPAQMLEFENCAITEMQYYGYNNNAAITSVEVMIWSGGVDEPTTLIYSEDVTSQVSYTDVWNDIMLASAVPFDNTESLWVGFYAEASGLSYPSSMGPWISPNTNGDWYSFNGGAWSHGNGIVPDVSWNINTFVTNDFDETVALNPMPVNERYGKAYPSELGMEENMNPEASRMYGTLDESSREIVGYNVYRGPCYGDEGDMVFLGFTLDQQFTDNTWGVQDPGVYKWAVEVVYDFNMSAFAFSNCLDKDMITMVTVEVTTNSGDSPEGTDVMFTNVSEIMDPPIVFETELDASGIYTWDNFRKGTYDIYVHLNGFIPIMVEDVYIWDEAYFEFLLEELLAPPTDLYVTPMGYATWTPGGVVPFEPYFENFDEGLPDTWTIIDGGTTTDTWFWTESDAGSTLDGTPFMFVDSDAAGIGSQSDEILISPVIPLTENADALFLEFDQYYNNLSTTEYGNVDVWDGDEWVNVLSQSSDMGGWGAPDHQIIDVSEYANDDFQVRFHYYAPGWYWYWAVDNVSVNEGEEKYADRMLEYYKVWHDFTFITDRDTSFYQYGDNGEELIPGTTYMAEVASVFSTGISAKSWYEWTYYPCDSFPGPVQFFAENIPDTKDVLLTWSADPPPFNGVFEDFEDGMPAEFITDGDRWSVYDGNLTMDGNSVANYGSAYYDMMFDDFVFEFEITRHESTGTLGNTLGCLVRSDGLHDTGSQNGYAFAITQSGSWWYAKYIDGVLSDWTGWLTSTAINSGLGNSNVVSIVANGPSLEYYINGTMIHSITDADYTEGYCDVFAYDGSAGTNQVTFDYYSIVPGEDAKSVTVIEDVQVAGTGTIDECTTPSVASLNLPAEGVKAMSAERDMMIGTNIYRDGEMIAFVPEPDTFYVDMDLVPEYYDYCISFLYESGAYSCIDGACILDVLVPEDCDAPQGLTATLDEETYDAIYLAWNGFTEVFITQNPGAPANGYFQAYDNGYGVVYDLSAYPDALAHSIEFHHASWGVFGPFDYNIHIIDWDTETTLAVLGPFITTGDDIWEMDVDLGDTDLMGAENVAFLMEPLSNSPTDAYPDLSSDNAADPQGSVYGPLAGPIGPSTIGNFLMNIYIMTTMGKQVMAPRALDLPAAVPAIPRIGEPQVVTESIISNQTAEVTNSREFIGYNIYRDGDLIEELWPENMYTDTEGLEPGNLYCYEVTSMYSICGESDPSNEACAGFVGIPELDAGVANLYPNPARDMVTIEAADMTRLHIVNYVGQVVYDQEFESSNSQQLNTQKYQSGVYVARIYTEAGIITKRFVINK